MYQLVVLYCLASAPVCDSQQAAVAVLARDLSLEDCANAASTGIRNPPTGMRGSARCRLTVLVPPQDAPAKP